MNETQGEGTSIVRYLQVYYKIILFYSNSKYALLYLHELKEAFSLILSIFTNYVNVNIYTFSLNYFLFSF